VRISLHADASSLLAVLGRMAAMGNGPMSSPPIRDAVVDAGRTYMGDMRARFTGASGGNGTWAPLAPATIYKRLRAAGNPSAAIRKAQSDPRLAAAVAAALPILYVTGGLYTSLAPGGDGYVEDVLPDRLLVGTSNRVARFHQDGTPKMPARPVLVAPDDQGLKRMRDLIAAGVGAAVASAIAGTN
jgi:hypothetical protein